MPVKSAQVQTLKAAGVFAVTAAANAVPQLCRTSRSTLPQAGSQGKTALRIFLATFPRPSGLG